MDKNYEYVMCISVWREHKSVSKVNIIISVIVVVAVVVSKAPNVLLHNLCMCNMAYV